MFGSVLSIYNLSVEQDHRFVSSKELEYGKPSGINPKMSSRQRYQHLATTFWLLILCGFLGIHEAAKKTGFIHQYICGENSE